MRFILLGLCSAYAFLLSGCASSWQYVKAPDRQVKVANTSKARIYVIRAEPGSKLASARISDNGTLIGNTGPHGYLCWEREPGTMKLASVSADEVTTELKVAAGGVYYVRQTVDPGFIYGKNSLTVVPEEAGAALLKSCKPAYVTRAEPVWKRAQLGIESANPSVVSAGTPFGTAGSGSVGSIGSGSSGIVIIWR